MKAGIHPEYQKALITCACGRVTETQSTQAELHVEICSHCHPFFTGRQKLVDTAGRVERFMAKYGKEQGDNAEARTRSEPDAESAAAADEVAPSHGDAPEPEGESEELQAKAATATNEEEAPLDS